MFLNGLYQTSLQILAVSNQTPRTTRVFSRVCTLELLEVSVIASSMPAPYDMVTHHIILASQILVTTSIHSQALRGWVSEQCFTSPPTQCRLYSRRFLQVWWPNQQCQSTEGGWLVIQTGLNLTRLTSPCYNTTTCMQILHKKIIYSNTTSVCD